MRIDRKSVIIIVLALALAVFMANWLLESHCAACTQRGIDGTLQGIADQVRMRGAAISINVGGDQLICSTRGLLYGDAEP